MSTENSYADHLAWCGLIALGIARQDGVVSSVAQENLFLCRWLAVAEKKRLFRRELALDIGWLLKEGREKGLRADLPGKLEYLWRSNQGDLLAQSDLYRLQHIMHAIKLSGINYAVHNEKEWEGINPARLSLKVPGIIMRKADLEQGFDEQGNQINPILMLITADEASVDALLLRAGWKREAVSDSPCLHQLNSSAR